jgi:hypothetical protein
MADERPHELIDRAYQAGALATSAATDAQPMPDRRGAIRALGIIMIVLGGISGLLALFMMVVTSISRGRHPLAAAFGALIYGIPAANLLVTGIGSVRIAPWARRATLISAAIWLGLMMLVVVARLATGGPGAFAIGRGEMVLLAIIGLPVLLVVVALPIVLLIVYTRPSVRATFERRGASARQVA